MGGNGNYDSNLFGERGNSPTGFGLFRRSEPIGDRGEGGARELLGEVDTVCTGTISWLEVFGICLTMLKVFLSLQMAKWGM
jgi:hypothetical protein